ncbi:MAG: hypothetical protein ACKVTZ_04260 [Bacteroidia bacterium]
MKESKARNLFGGYEAWAQNFPFINTLMHFLQWFTVPIEVLFRRDFGERWFTTMNFYVGLLVLSWFTFLQKSGSLMEALLSNTPFGKRETPVEDPSLLERFMSNIMIWILFVYVAMSAFHFFKIWWRNRTFKPLHSFDDGTSRLEPLAAGVMDLVNMAVTPIVRLFMLVLPEQERQKVKDIPRLLNNVTVFTDTIFEPLVILGLSFFVFSGTASTWLFISAIAMAIFANWKHTQRLNFWLDMRDSSIDAKAMIEVKDYLTGDNQQVTGGQKIIMEQIAETVKETPAVAQQMQRDYPDVMDIIKEMNAPKKG